MLSNALWSAAGSAQSSWFDESNCCFVGAIARTCIEYFLRFPSALWVFTWTTRFVSLWSERLIFSKYSVVSLLTMSCSSAERSLTPMNWMLSGFCFGVPDDMIRLQVRAYLKISVQQFFIICRDLEMYESLWY